jgi:EAL domain-containing protein (putative c-di-GMP-specific phosphodiesterase class I)
VIAGEHKVVVTTSIGIAMSPAHGSDVERLMKNADTAMLNAKKRGKNHYLMYEDGMRGSDIKRLEIENDLRYAIEREQLLLHYQPQVDIENYVVCGAEALIRWEHPTRGMMPPNMYIPLAEELGLIGPIGDWVVKEACRQLAELRGDGLSLPRVSVNVSASQLRPEFVGHVQSCLTEYGLPPSSLELELTEGVIIDNDEQTVATLLELADCGVRLSIDDFGTGYSSLSYLSRLPLSELKIDRSFVRGTDESAQQRELIRGIIALGKALDLEVVVEGVETVNQFAFFRQCEARILQGFLFSKPLTFERLRSVVQPGYFRAQINALEIEMETKMEMA